MRKCDVCQRFDNVIHVPTEALNFVTSPWPFYKWGINIVGLLPLSTSQRKLIVRLEKFQFMEKGQNHNFG